MTDYVYVLSLMFKFKYNFLNLRLDLIFFWYNRIYEIRCLRIKNVT